MSEVSDPVSWLVERRQLHRSQGGGALAGYLGFEFGWRLDKLNGGARRSAAPELWVGDFSAQSSFDHQSQRWTVNGRSQVDLDRAVGRLERAIVWEAEGEKSGGRRRTGLEVSPNHYQEIVETGVRDIYGGEFFEVNYTERFFGEWSGSRSALYDKFRRIAPGAFGGCLSVPQVFVASISPEQFLKVTAEGDVITRPIKGTRPRAEDPDEDGRRARELLASAKDRAENIMIVDLMRNDLTRVCELGSVRATEICELHSFASVHHLVSTVEGQLAQDLDALDALLVAFPAGSITGAPKLRAMEWIAAYEATPRGPYTGSLFYCTDQGDLDSNVLIRTAVFRDGQLDYGAGGAVVADSVAADEYEEALWKARPFFELLEQ